MIDQNTFEYNNEEEAEIAQIQNLFSNQNAISAVQQKLAEQRKQESLENCEECGEEIPQARREAIKGVTLCIYCQGLFERKQKGF